MNSWIGLLGSLAAYGVITVGGTSPADDAPAQRLATLTRGGAALRAMDCARCHGKDYRGWAAPSLIAAVRDAPRERFDRFVLDGDVTRGMPGYRSQPLVVAELDAMYAFLRALAEPPGDSDASAPAASSR